MPQTHPLQSSDPVTLGDYRLIGRLGKGAQGIVYKAESPDGRLVAIKLLNTRLDKPGIDSERFLREVAAARRVAQFCTAQVLGANLDGEQPYIVSELVDGVSLQVVVQRDGPREGGALHRLAVGTVTALAAIHRAGIVHRDFKPSNVLLGTDGPRVIDFGIARALDSAMTISSGVVGTPAYMSPEQISGERVGPAGDMFSWALTMLYAATGRPAFGQDSLPAVIYRVMHEEPDLSVLPDELRAIVQGCLRKRGEERPAAAEVLFSLLENQGEAAGDDESALTTGSQVAAEAAAGAAVGGWIAPDGRPGLGAPAASTWVSPTGWVSPSGDGYTPPPGPPAGPPPAAQAPHPPAPSPGPPAGHVGASPQGPPAGHAGGPPAAYAPRPPAPSHGSPTGHVGASPQGPPAQAPHPPAPPHGSPAGRAAAPSQGPAAGTPPARPPAPPHGSPAQRTGAPPPRAGQPAVLPQGAPVSPRQRPAPQPSPAQSPPYDRRGDRPGDGNDAFFRHAPAEEKPDEARARRRRAALVAGTLVVALTLAGGVLYFGPRMLGTEDGTVAQVTTSVTPPTTPPTTPPPTPTPTVVTPTPAEVERATVPVLGKQDGKSLKGHTKGVQTLSAVRNGDKTWLVTGGQDGRVRLWDLAGHKPLATMRGHSEEVYAVACVMMGKTPMAVSGGYDGSVRLWNLKTRKGRVLGWHGDAVYAVALTKVKGRYVAVTGDADGYLRFWDLSRRRATGKLIRAHRKPVNWLSASHVGDRAVAVSASEDETLRMWDMSSRKRYGTTYKGHSKGVYAVAVSKIDGKAVVASGGKDGKIRLWEAKSGKTLGTMSGHKKIVYSLSFGTMGERTVLLSGGTDGTIRLWDPRTRKALGKPVKAHKSGVYAVGVVPLDEGVAIVSAGKDKLVRIWKAGDGAIGS
ncbi:serine/threonine-protein kinase [Nonomuraea monospora]|uniref:serine/threonine-protein kinase n=1 Tax=Nonomuraea monospora TaxID=568818 RepID=UPI0031CE424B